MRKIVLFVFLVYFSVKAHLRPMSFSPPSTQTIPAEGMAPAPSLIILDLRPDSDTWKPESSARAGPPPEANKATPPNKLPKVAARRCCWRLTSSFIWGAPRLSTAWCSMGRVGSGFVRCVQVRLETSPPLPPPTTHYPSPSTTPFTPCLAYLRTKGAEGHGGLDELPGGTAADGHHEASCGRARGGEQNQDSGKTHLILGVVWILRIRQ